MTDTDDSTPLRAVFFDGPEQAVAALSAGLRSGEAEDELRPVLGRLPKTARAAVLSEVGTAAAGLLNLSLADVFGTAWSKYRELVRAARATASNGNTRQLVQLVTHKMSFTHEPSVEMYVADLPAARISMVIELEVRIDGLIAVVQHGRLTGIRAGTGEAAGTLKLCGAQVAQRRTRLDLPLVVTFRRGFPLLDDVDAP
jgi:hypothetical protein